MHTYQKQFIEFALSHNALRFGDFTLKSGRKSPYFFNAGLFNTGEAIAQLGQYYAAAILQSGIEFDVIFGPAYKGIPLATAAAIALAAKGRNIGYCFNRKEVKDHGEGGCIVGAELTGRVLIIDDVITAGTAYRESAKLIANTPATIAGVVIALDRQERGQGKTSAIQDIQQQDNVPVTAIIGLKHLIEYLTQKQQQESLTKINAYVDKYGV